MAGFGIHEIIAELQAGRWPTAPCEIKSSGVSESPGSRSSGFVATVRYTYQWEGHTYFSDKIRIKPELIHSDVADAEARAAKFPKGARMQCHVNPANPREAILESRPDYILLALSPFLLAIWALYERVAIADWFERRSQSRLGTGKLPITANRAFKRTRTMPLVVGVLGLAVTTVFAVFLWILPWIQQRTSLSWQSVPCTITRVGVVTETTHQGGRFFKPQVVYEYEYVGEHHKSNRLDFSADMDFNYSRIRALVQSYRVGETNLCFVNPSSPTQAVLLRRFRADPFFSLFTAGFIGLSLFLIIQGLAWRPVIPSACPWEAVEARSAARPDESRLQPEIQPLPRFALSLIGLVACLAFALWLLGASWQSMRQGGVDILPLLYGIGAVVGAFFSAKFAWHFGRDLRHRGPILKLNPASITPGQSFNVEWEWPQQVRNPAFRLFLEGVESVRVMTEIPTQHGSSREEKSREWVFFSLALTRGEHPETSAFGQTRGELPLLTMHSFEGLKTKVLWRVRADFPQSGNFSRKYKVIVRPPRPNL